jgi:hypothetical protein
MNLVPIQYRSEYYAWRNMKNRCYYVRSESYHNYGARGIKVCDRWLHSLKIFYLIWAINLGRNIL